MNSDNKKCILILGMHRSGTSVLAGCMNILGMNLGGALMPGNEANQSGYFENRDIVLAHDILLRDLGCRWDMVGSLPRNWQESDAALKAQETLTRILQQQFLDKDVPFAVKDPRICRLMPLWRRVLKGLNIKPDAVLVLRHPMEVARSLQERDSFDSLKGHLLWLVHNREALAASRDLDHMFITFDQLLSDPVNALDRLTSLPSLAHLDPRKSAGDIIRFVRPELKHHHQHPSEKISDDLFNHYSWLYEQFRKRQAQSILAGSRAVKDEKFNSSNLPEVMEEFPLAVSGSGIIPARDDRRHAAEVLDNLLDVIGRYEQAEMDEAAQRLRRILSATGEAKTLFAQVYFPEPGTGTYSERESAKILLAPGEWQEVSLEVSRPEVLRTFRLRMDPLNTRGMALISGVKLVNAATGLECWTAPDRLAGFTAQGDALLIAGGSSLVMAATGDDPRLLLPEIPDLPDCPMRLEFWIKPGCRQDLLKKYWRSLVQDRNRLASRENELKESRDRTRQKLEKLQEKEKKLLQEIEELKSGERQSRKELEQEKKDREQLQEQVQARDRTIEGHEQQIREKDSSLEELEKQLENQKELTREYFVILSEGEKKQEELKEQLLEKESELEQKQKEHESGTRELEQRLRDMDRTIEGHKQQIREKDSSLEELEKQLASQKNLTTQYFHALAVAEEEQEMIRSRSRSLEDENRQLQEGMNRLHKDFKALLGSRRWRLGNALIGMAAKVLRRSGRKTAADRILETLDKLEHPERQPSPSVPKSEIAFAPGKADGRRMVRDMDRLHKDFKALLGSRRWRMGNALGNITGYLLFRSGKATAADRIERILSEFQDWRQNIEPEFLGPNETHKLQSWINRLDRDLQALLRSRRWKMGNALGRTSAALLRKPARVPAVERMENILVKYR